MPPVQVQRPSDYKPIGFERATRHHMRDIPTMTYSPGASTSVDLPPVGFLARIFLLVSGTFTATHASTTSLTKSSYGPFNLIKRIRLTANTGIDIINMSGFDLFLLNLHSMINCRADQSGDATTYAFGNVVASGGQSNSLVFGLELPVTLNDRDLTGLILLQNRTTVLTLTIDWADMDTDTGPFTDAATGTIGITNEAITANPVVEYFAIPEHREDYPPQNIIFQSLSVRQAIVAVGEQVLSLPRGNIYSRLITWHEHNNTLAPSTDLDKIEVRYNQSDVPYAINSDNLRQVMRQRYGRDVPQGVFSLDFNHQGIPNLGTARDYVNSAKLTDVQWRPTVASGATLGTGTNFLNAIYQQLVEIGN